MSVKVCFRSRFYSIALNGLFTVFLLNMRTLQQLPDRCRNDSLIVLFRFKFIDAFILYKDVQV